MPALLNLIEEASDQPQRIISKGGTTVWKLLSFLVCGKTGVSDGTDSRNGPVEVFVAFPLVFCKCASVHEAGLDQLHRVLKLRG
jgi:hypothetical protein